MEEKHLTPKEIKQYNKFISSLWGKISSKIDNIDWTHYAIELYNLGKEEAKRHDNFRGNNKRAITLTEEIKYFCVRDILKYVFDLENYKPTIKDYFHIKKSLIYAYAISLNFGDKIKEIVTEEDAKKVLSVEYTQLI